MKNLLLLLNIKWQKLRQIQKSKFISSMYIWILVVPVVAKILHKIDRYLIFDFFGREIEIVISLPFSWKVFFFSALSFSIANTIVLLACPQIVKDHLSFAGFKGDGKDEDHLKMYAKEIGDEYLHASPSLDSKLAEDFGVSSNENIRKEFWRIYDKGNLARSFFRVPTIGFYAIGVGLFLWVLGMNIYWVIKYIL